MKILFCSVALFFTGPAFSQTTYVEYEVTSLNASRRSFIEFDENSTSAGTKDPIPDNQPAASFFLKDRQSESIYLTEQIFNVVFYIKDSLYPMNWEMLDDTASILEQNCMAAKTIFRGRVYTAYFSPGIPSDSGPWKFGGLPGLILRVKSQDNFIGWEAITIKENRSGRIKLPVLEKYNFLTWTAFVDKFKETVGKVIKMVKSNGNRPKDGETNLKVDATEIFYAELQTGKGIKF